MLHLHVVNHRQVLLVDPDVVAQSSQKLHAALFRRDVQHAVHSSRQSPLQQLLDSVDDFGDVEVLNNQLSPALDALAQLKRQLCAVCNRKFEEFCVGVDLLDLLYYLFVGVPEEYVDQDLGPVDQPFVLYVGMQEFIVAHRPVGQLEDVDIEYHFMVVIPEVPQQHVDFIMHKLDVHFDDFDTEYWFDSAGINKVSDLSE
jgi:hypothetical protein